jgi:hypothetical protein
MFNNTRLYDAIARNDHEAMTRAIAKGADLAGFRDRYGHSFLEHAIDHGNVDAAKLLIAKGAPVSEKSTGYNGTPLHAAARKGSLEITQLLLEKNPELLSAKNASGDTALHAAAERGHTDVVEFLIAKGADPAQKNYNNRAPLFLARENRHEDTVAALRAHIPAPPRPAPQAPVGLPQAPAVVQAAALRAVPAPRPAAPENADKTVWKKLPGERIAAVRLEGIIGYRITEIFNFAARERTTLYQNLETKMETVETRGFDQLGDRAALEEALAELRRRGGTSDAGSLTALDKKKPEGLKPIP